MSCSFAISIKTFVLGLTHEHQNAEKKVKEWRKKGKEEVVHVKT